MASIQAVGFAIMSPESLWVILKYRDYKILVANEDGTVVVPAGTKNLVVIAPDFKRLNALAPMADQIHRVLVMAKGQHPAVLKRGIPLLDAVVQPDGSLVPCEVKPAQQYRNEIEREAVEIDLAVPVVPVTAPPPAKRTKTPGTLAAHVDHIGSLVPASFPLDSLISKPAGLFCLGSLSRQEYKASLKAAVQAGLDDQAAKHLYRWVQQYSVVIANAAQAAITKAESTGKLAARFAVPQEDLDLIVSVYR